ncbi:tetratricopeptide repeat protein [Flammeovirga sp. EKP202]|uniref:tetratricopeptide repeat protein n=1 Tax=Flammeovirga sp. EKP202 TaxID=2770592 RepID=UPI00165FB319|nr:tetratricopeptide repeat protein [Flammeovirga sp. EKP202]MBD0404067.1 tetratricopeptide repeat protein [Flammeovirga sp. EKP202]
MKYQLLLISFLVISTNIFANSEKKFWKLFKSSKLDKASVVAEKIGKSNIDYLYLSAICNHLNYDYSLFYQKSDYFHHMKNGNYETLEKLLKDNYAENDYTLNNLLGIIKNSISSINLQSAQSYFEKSIALESNNPIAHNYLSMIYIQNGDIEKGIAAAQTAIKQNSNYPEPYNNLAFAYYQKGENKMAIDQLIECMKMCPKNTNSTYMSFIQLSCEEVVLLVNNIMGGVPGFTNDADREYLLQALKGKNSALLGLAQQFYDYNSYNEAEIFLRQVKADQSNQNQLYSLKSMNAIATGDTINHVTNVDKLVELKAFEEVLNIGNAFYQNQEMTLALSSYQKAATIAKSKESKVRVLSNLGTANLQLGNYGESIKIFEKVLKINAKDDITLTNLGITYALNDDNETAKKYLLKAKEHCSSANQMSAIEQWLQKVEVQ